MDINYRQLLAIRDAGNLENEERLDAIMQAIYGEDVIDLPLAQFINLAKNLDFLTKPVPTDVKIKEYTVNGREYFFDGLFGHITYAQYVDFENYSKNSNDEAKCFAVFFIPKGHKYNDGYDMMQVFDDIMDMPAPVLLSAAFFFEKQLFLFRRIFQSSLKKKIKKMKLPKEAKQNLQKMVDHLLSLEQPLLY